MSVAGGNDNRQELRREQFMRVADQAIACTVPADLFARRGVVRLARTEMQARPARALQVMARLVVMRCEPADHGHSFVYHAVSPFFDPVGIGQAAPEYVVTVRGGWIRFERRHRLLPASWSD